MLWRLRIPTSKKLILAYPSTSMEMQPKILQIFSRFLHVKDEIGVDVLISMWKPRQKAYMAKCWHIPLRRVEEDNAADTVTDYSNSSNHHQIRNEGAGRDDGKYFIGRTIDNQSKCLDHNQGAWHLNTQYILFHFTFRVHYVLLSTDPNGLFSLLCS